jgi:hypothetical protein
MATFLGADTAVLRLQVTAACGRAATRADARAAGQAVPEAKYSGPWVFKGHNVQYADDVVKQSGGSGTSSTSRGSRSTWSAESGKPAGVRGDGSAGTS